MEKIESNDQFVVIRMSREELSMIKSVFSAVLQNFESLDSYIVQATYNKVSDLDDSIFNVLQLVRKDEKN